LFLVLLFTTKTRRHEEKEGKAPQAIDPLSYIFWKEE